MHITSRAPELSATMSLDCCWIICYVPSALPLDDADQPPTLARRQRTGLHDLHEIPFLRIVRFVVGHHLGGQRHDASILWVALLALDRQGDALVHLVANHAPDDDLAASALVRRGDGFDLSLAHRIPLTFSVMTVFNRAISRLAWFREAESSSLPKLCCNLFWKSPSLASTKRSWRASGASWRSSSGFWIFIGCPLQGS